MKDGWERKRIAEIARHSLGKMVAAEKSDLFDVLAKVAYALPPRTREQRAAKAKVEIVAHFNSRQQIFLDFVLSHYVNVGVDELGPEKQG